MVCATRFYLLLALLASVTHGEKSTNEAIEEHNDKTRLLANDAVSLEMILEEENRKAVINKFSDGNKSGDADEPTSNELHDVDIINGMSKNAKHPDLVTSDEKKEDIAKDTDSSVNVEDNAKGKLGTLPKQERSDRQLNYYYDDGYPCDQTYPYNYYSNYQTRRNCGGFYNTNSVNVNVNVDVVRFSSRSKEKKGKSPSPPNNVVDVVAPCDDYYSYRQPTVVHKTRRYYGSRYYSRDYYGGNFWN